MVKIRVGLKQSIRLREREQKVKVLYQMPIQLGVVALVNLWAQKGRMLAQEKRIKKLPWPRLQRGSKPTREVQLRRISKLRKLNVLLEALVQRRWKHREDWTLPSLRRRREQRSRQSPLKPNKWSKQISSSLSTLHHPRNQSHHRQKRGKQELGHPRSKSAVNKTHQRE